MIRPFRIRRSALCGVIGVGGTYVSAWVGAVEAQRLEARTPPGPPNTCVGMGLVTAPASAELVAAAPKAGRGATWWRSSRGPCGVPPTFEKAEAYIEAPGGQRCLRVERARHGWPWAGAQSVRLFDSWLYSTAPISQSRGDPGAERVTRALAELGLSARRWRPYEGVRDLGVYALHSDEARLPAWRRGLRVASPDAPPDEHLLPLDPVWPGFAYNTLAYGGAAWALLATPTLVGFIFGRKRRRRRRGLCVACGYDMRGLESCPECGGSR